MLDVCRLLCVSILVVSGACNPAETESGDSDAGDVGRDTPESDSDLSTPAEPTQVLEPASPEPTPAWTVEIVDGMAQVPAGMIHAGSLPGTPGRIARAEADQTPLEVGAFQIDVTPFLGENGEALVNVGRGRAAELCAGEEKRLCSELEWERACEGPSEDRFAGGEVFDANGISGFGTELMGERAEWVLGEASRDLAPSVSESAVFRGAAADRPAPFHRCAARRGTEATTESRNITFRCCLGDSPSPEYPDEPQRARFRALDLDTDAIREILRQVPAVAQYAEDFEPTTIEQAQMSLGVDEEDAVSETRTETDAETEGEAQGLARLNGWEVAAPAMAWSPAPLDEVWLFNGSSGGRSVLIAVYPMAPNRLEHAVSIALEPEAGPIVLAYTHPERTILHWSTNWGRTAAGGVLVLRDDNTLAIQIR